MHRRELLTATVATAVGAAGCLGLGGTDPGRLDLTVRNDGDDPVDVDVGETGRHEVVVTGADWQGRLAWDAGVCALYDGTVAVDGESVEVAGECVDPR